MKKNLANLKSTVCAVALCGALMVGAPAVANAADMALEPGQDHRNWTGFFFGANVGLGVFDGSGIDPTSAAYGTSTEFLGGLNLGYDRQVDDIVIGIEGDISIVDYADGSYSSDHYAEIDTISTVRARLGFVNDESLFYTTLGVGVITGFAASSEASASTEGDFTALAAVGGVGFEHRLTENLTAKIEGLALLPENIGGLVGASDALDVSSIFIVRAGMNWRF